MEGGDLLVAVLHDAVVFAVHYPEPDAAVLGRDIAADNLAVSPDGDADTVLG